MSAGLETIFLKAKHAEKRGDAQEARRLLTTVVSRYPNNRKALEGLARLDGLAAGAESEAASIAALSKLLAAGEHYELLDQGATLADRFPRNGAIWRLLGEAYLAIREYEQAEKMLRVSLRMDAGSAQGHALLAMALTDLGRVADAETSCAEALRLDPDCLAGHHALGRLHLRTKNHMAAVDALLATIARKPDHFEAVLDLGNALIGLGYYGGAADVLHQATLIDPDNVKGLMLSSDLLRLMGQLDKAWAAVDRSHLLRPHSNYITANLLSLEGMMCDWHRRDAFSALPAHAEGVEAITPFIALPFEDDPARQLVRSRAWSKATLKWSDEPVRLPPRPAGERIRIGYLSADFHDHATMWLMSGLFREHDRNRFEIRAYSFGSGSGGMRETMLPHVDAFIDLRDKTDDQAVDIVRRDGLDIAVDLKGHTTESRAELFAARMAPLQIAYLGFPGSMGGPYMDYLIADDIVIPAGHERFYSEKIIRIPGCYQANDNRRAIGTCAGDRAAFGLPADGFVFCSFNQNYKITPAEWDIWMRLLSQVEGSVLWLIRSNRWAEDNLRQEARARGVDPARIVFADKMAHHDHLARHRHADLFLDTFIVNAHTTASDALWAGLPVVTLKGRQFAARVAASLLDAVGLPDLIADTARDYEALALDLARHPDRLAEVTARLAANRLSTPLFDTPAHAKAMEAAFAAAHGRRLDGLSPDHIRIG